MQSKTKKQLEQGFLDFLSAKLGGRPNNFPIGKQFDLSGLPLREKGTVAREMVPSQLVEWGEIRDTTNSN